MPAPPTDPPPLPSIPIPPAKIRKLRLGMTGWLILAGVVAVILAVPPILDGLVVMNAGALARNSAIPGPLQHQGTKYLNQRDNDKAIAEFDEAIRLDPTLALAYVNRAAAYVRKGESDKAIADCTEAIRLDPTLAMAYGNRGGAYVNKGENDKAVADCTEAIKHDPKCAFAYSVRGTAYVQNRQGTVVTRPAKRRILRSIKTFEQIDQAIGKQ